MKTLTPTPEIKIYRDGNFSLYETYLPVVKRELAKFGNKIDYFFVHHSWPKES